MAYKLEPKTNRQTSTGRYHPLGSTLYEDGVNFAIFSQYASEAFLLLFDRPDVGPTDIIKLEDRTKYIWHGIRPWIKSWTALWIQNQG